MKTSISIQSFLATIGTSVFAYSNGKVDMHFVKTIQEGFQRNAKNRSDLYFVANPSTGMKADSLTHLRCNFVDLDCGRPSETTYYDMRRVNRFKTKVSQALKSEEYADIVPSYIVETRNGFQLYWVYDRSLAINRDLLAKWNTIEKYLVHRFASLGADPFVVKANQLLRVPGSYWHKRWEGNGRYPSFLTILHSAKNRKFYRFSDLYKKACSDTLPHTAFTTVALARRNPTSYAPSHDVNCSRSTTFTVDDPIVDAIQWTPSVNSEPYTEGLSTDVQLLNDIAEYLRQQKMMFLANQLTRYISSLRNV